MAKQLLGKEVTGTLNEKIRSRADKLREQGIVPKMAFIRVGERPDDLSYERGASKRCETLGVEYEKYILPICEESAIIGHCVNVSARKLCELMRCPLCSTTM